MSTGGKSKMKIKVKKVLSLSFTFITVILSAIGLALYYSDSSVFDPSKATAFLPFTINSNIFLAVAGLVFLVVGIIDLVENKPLPQWLMQVKLAATTLISVTLLTVIFFLAPLWNLNEANIEFAYKGCNLFLHVLAPTFAIVGFCLFDVETKIKWRWIWLSTLLVVIYAGVYTALIFINEDLSFDIYNFIHEKGTAEINYIRMAISVPTMIVGTFALSNIWWALNLASYKCTNKEKVEESVAPVEEKKETGEPVAEKKVATQPAPASKVAVQQAKPAQPASKPATTQATKPATQQAKPVAQTTTASKTVTVKAAPAPVKKAPAKPANNLYNGNTRTYHISTTKSLLGKWQVKLAGGEKAIKVCATQQEAIDYTRELVKSQGGSIRLHSLDGRIRKI